MGTLPNDARSIAIPATPFFRNMGCKKEETLP
jgi:hypothetical protein